MSGNPGYTRGMKNISLRTYGQFLRHYLLPQRGAVAVMAALLAGSIVLQVIAPQIVRVFIDATQAGTDQPALLRAAGLFIGVVALQQVAKVLAAFWSARVAWTATNALRADLTAHLLRLDPSFHKARTPG